MSPLSLPPAECVRCYLEAVSENKSTVSPLSVSVFSTELQAGKYFIAVETEKLVYRPPLIIGF